MFLLLGHTVQKVDDKQYGTLLIFKSKGAIDNRSTLDWRRNDNWKNTKNLKKRKMSKIGVKFIVSEGL